MAESRREWSQEEKDAPWWQGLFLTWFDKNLSWKREREDRRERERREQAAREFAKTSGGGLKVLEGPLVGGVLALGLVGAFAGNEKLRVWVKKQRKRQFGQAWSSAKGIKGFARAA